MAAEDIGFAIKLQRPESVPSDDWIQAALNHFRHSPPRGVMSFSVGPDGGRVSIEVAASRPAPAPPARTPADG